MTLTEENSEQLIISHYTPGNLSIREQSYQTSILITPTGNILDWSVQNLDELNDLRCQEILAYHPEIIIIGTGAHHRLPDLNIIHYFTQHRIGIEMMSTSAACRTYNVLALEGRKILAALIIN